MCQLLNWHTALDYITEYSLQSGTQHMYSVLIVLLARDAGKRAGAVVLSGIFDGKQSRL
jgi:hypothetical protein